MYLRSIRNIDTCRCSEPAVIDVDIEYALFDVNGDARWANSTCALGKSAAAIKEFLECCIERIINPVGDLSSIPCAKQFDIGVGGARVS